MNEDEEVYILSGDELNESLVLLDLHSARAPQGQTKEYAELKNSFLALMKAYDDLRKKLIDTKTELITLKRRSAVRGSSSKDNSLFQSPVASASEVIDSSKLTEIIMKMNSQTVDMIQQIDATYVNSTLASGYFRSVKPIANADSSMQASIETKDTGTQWDVPEPEALHQASQSGESLNNFMGSPEKTFHSADSSMVMADLSDVDEDLPNNTNSLATVNPNGNYSETSESGRVPEVPRIADSQVRGLLLVEPARQRNPSNGNQEYSCPNCNREFTADILETEVVAHLMNCTASLAPSVTMECPSCSKVYQLNSEFTQQDFEVHVQYCCETWDLSAVETR